MISTTINDGKWHHACATWHTADGSWAFYKDGVVVASGSRLKERYVISRGSLVLGQEQITEHSFARHAFVGELGNFNIWNDLVTAMEVLKMSKSCSNGKGSVFMWFGFRSGIKGKVKLVTPSSCAR